MSYLPDIKFCECGCGEPTRVAARTNSAQGDVKGQPRRFLKGHNTRKRFGPPTLERYEPDAHTGCWVWQGRLNRWGYGAGWANGKDALAHRIFFEAHKGPIAPGLEVHHICGNRRCVNPSHLVALDRGTHCKLGRAPKTHCKRGHEFTEDNTYVRKGGDRNCRACERARMARYRARKKAAR